MRIVTAGSVLVTPETAIAVDFVFKKDAKYNEALIEAMRWAIKRIEFEIEELTEKGNDR